MSSNWLSRGFDESSSEELERSMEHEVEGLMEIDDLDLLPGATEQTAEEDLWRAERAVPRAERAVPRAGRVGSRGGRTGPRAGRTHPAAGSSG